MKEESEEDEGARKGMAGGLRCRRVEEKEHIGGYHRIAVDLRWRRVEKQKQIGEELNRMATDLR